MNGVSGVAGLGQAGMGAAGSPAAGTAVPLQARPPATLGIILGVRRQGEVLPLVTANTWMLQLQKVKRQNQVHVLVHFKPLSASEGTS